MTAATVELYLRDQIRPDELYFSHPEITQGVIDGVLDDMAERPDALMVCVRWHDHDYCNDPDVCRGNEPLGDDFHFFVFPHGD